MKTGYEVNKIAKSHVMCGLFTFAFSVLFAPSPVFCLEKMDKSRLRSETGQAGIDIGMDNVVIYHGVDSVKIANPADPENNYVSLEKIKGLGVFETGAADVGGDNIAGKLTIDVGNVINSTSTTEDDIPLVFLSCPDWMQNIDIIIENVNWCGNNIGSADIRGFSLPSWHAYIGSCNGAGVDFQLGFRTKIEEMAFNYGDAGESFSVKKLQAAASFTGEPENNPDGWTASGEFRVGDAISGSSGPASIDIGVRSDSVSPGTPVVLMELNASGSVRAADISFGSKSFGPMAIDGIKVHSMKIELPGRGLGGNN